MTILSLLFACGEDAAGPCRVAADCASGVCLPDGRCASPGDTGDDVDVLFPGDIGDAGDVTGDGTDDTPSDSTPSDTTAPADTAPPLDTASDTGDTGAADSDTSPSCLPNRDGVITRAEVPIAPGLSATFLVASDVSFDSRGDTNADPRWDMAQAFTGETRALVTTLDPTDTWYGPDFPTATYATKLADDGDLLGVFEAKDDGLYLLGVVSPEDGLFRTELAYDPPARILAYPLTLEKTWTSTSSVSGLTNGVVTFASETYEGKVDASGRLSTPFATFDVLRAVVTLDRWVGAALYFDVSHFFVTECFGTVATLRSEAYVTGPELDTAAELRRLSP